MVLTHKICKAPDKVTTVEPSNSKLSTQLFYEAISNHCNYSIMRQHINNAFFCNSCNSNVKIYP